MESTGEKADSSTTGNNIKSYDDGRDTGASGSKTKLPNENRPVEGQSATTDTSGSFSKPKANEVVQVKDKAFESVKDRNDTIFKREKTQKELNEFVKKSLEDGNFEDVYEFKISDNASNKLKKFTNMLFKDYKSLIESQYIRHAKRSHKEDIKIFDDYVDIVENFDYARKSLTRNRRTGKNDVSVELYKKGDDGLYKVVQLKNFDDKTLEFRTMFKLDEADQNLPQDLRLWIDAKSKDFPLPSRPNTESDGFIENSISKNDKESQIFKREKTQKEIHKQNETLYNRYSKKVDKTVDFLFENIGMKGLEKLSTPLKAGIDAMTGDKWDISSKNWWEVSDISKKTNELITEFNTNKSIIYDTAQELRQSLSHLSKEDNRDLLKVLNGDMNLGELKADLKPLYKRFRKQIDKNANELVELGILKEDEKIKDYVKRYYKKYLEDSGEIKNIPSKGFQQFYKRKDLDYETRVKLGMVEDAGLVVANTLAEQNILKHKAKLLQKLADTFAQDKEMKGYVRVSDETVKEGVYKWGALAGKYVPAELKKELDGARIVNQELGILEKYLYSLVDHIKVNVTVKNPPTHIYNIVSNLSLSFILGDLPTVIKTIKMMVFEPDEFKALVKKANEYGLNSYLDEWENPQVDFFKDGKVSVSKSILKNLYMTQDSKTGKFVRKLYDWEDKIFKVARFKRLLDQGMDEKLAYKEAITPYVDYSTPVPAALKVLDKSGLMPFLHYQYKATPEVAKAIAKNPLKSAILATGIASIGGLRWQDEDEGVKPEWAENKFNLFGAKEWVKVGNSGYYWNLGRLVPGTKFDFDFGGFEKGLAYIVDGRSPLGYKVTDIEDDPIFLKRASMVMHNYAPPITYGRYGERYIKIGLGEAGVIKPPKNPVSKKPDTIKDTALRSIGVREFKKNPKKKPKPKEVGFDLGDIGKTLGIKMPKFEL